MKTAVKSVLFFLQEDAFLYYLLFTNENCGYNLMFKNCCQDLPLKPASRHCIFLKRRPFYNLALFSKIEPSIFSLKTADLPLSQHSSIASLLKRMPFSNDEHFSYENLISLLYHRNKANFYHQLRD